MINSLLDEYIPSIRDVFPASTQVNAVGSLHSESRHHAHVVDQTGQIQPARHCQALFGSSLKNEAANTDPKISAYIIYI